MEESNPIQKRGRAARGLAVVLAGGLTLAAGLVLGAGAYRCVCKHRNADSADVSPGMDKASEGIDRYLNRLVERTGESRAAYWQRDFSSLSNYLTSVSRARKDLADLLGLPPDFRESNCPALLSDQGVATNGTGEIRHWTLATGNGALPLDALVGIPRNRPSPFPLVILFYGTGGSPERVFGLDGVPDYHRRMAAVLMEHGYLVFVPYIVTQTGANPNQRRNQLDHRALAAGARLIGIELGQCMDALDYLSQLEIVDERHMTTYGISLGGFLSFHLAALDTRVAAAVVSQYIEDRIGKLAGRNYPEAYWQYENADWALFPGYLQRYTDYDIASLIAPRKLFIEVGRQDARSQPSRQVFEDIRGLYESLAQPAGSVALEIGEGGHEAFLAGSLEFLKQWTPPGPRKP